MKIPTRLLVLAGASLAAAAHASPVLFVTGNYLDSKSLQFQFRSANPPGSGGKQFPWFHRPVPLEDNSEQLKYEQNLALTYLRSQYPAPQWSFSAAPSGFSTPIQLAYYSAPDIPPNSNDGAAPSPGVTVGIDAPQPAGPYVTREYIVIQRRFNDTNVYRNNYWISPQQASIQSLGTPFVPRGRTVVNYNISTNTYTYAQDGFQVRPKTFEFWNILQGKIDACVTTAFVALHSYDQYGNHGVTLYNGFIHQNSFPTQTHPSGSNNLTVEPRKYPWSPATSGPSPY